MLNKPGVTCDIFLADPQSKSTLPVLVLTKKEQRWKHDRVKGKH